MGVSSVAVGRVVIYFTKAVLKVEYEEEHVLWSTMWPDDEVVG